MDGTQQARPANTAYDRTQWRVLDAISTPTPEVFAKQYFSPRRPILMKGMAKSWGCSSWTPSFFAAAFPGVEVGGEKRSKEVNTADPMKYLAAVRAGGRSHTMTMRDFVDSLTPSSESRDQFYAILALTDSMPQLIKQLA